MKNIKRSEIQFLKFFVYMMGFVLVGATVFLTYIAYKKNFSPSAIIEQVGSQHKCTNLNLNLSGRLQNMSMEDGVLSVTWRDENGLFKVSVYDYCTSELINEITINDHSGPNKIIEPQKHEDINVEEKNIVS